MSPVVPLLFALASEPATISLTLRSSGESLHHRVSWLEGGVVGDCVGACTLHLAPGRYVIETDATESAPSGRTVVRLDRPATVTAGAGSRTQRRVGVALGVTGIVATIGGIIGLVWNAPLCVSESRCREGNPTAAAVWTGVVVAGVGLNFGGWIAFAKAGTKLHVERTDVALTTDGRTWGLRVVW